MGGDTSGLTCAANGGPAFTDSDYSLGSSSGLGLPPTMGPRPDVNVLERTGRRTPARRAPLRSMTSGRCVNGR